MSLTTRSKFYYGFETDSDALYLDFDEGGGELTAEYRVGSYSLTEFADETERALNDAGALTYTVTVDRATRVVTIAATGVFALRVASGTHGGATVFGLLGFTGANRTGSASYAGNTGAGFSYSTQFVPQSYVGPNDFQASAYGSVNKSASGKIEVVSFGIERFARMDLKFCTDLPQITNGPIRNNPTGLADLQALMQFLVTKAPVEFIPDESDPTTFLTLSLESTPDDSKGLKYQLRELYDKGLPGYFDTGLLLFRLTG